MDKYDISESKVAEKKEYKNKPAISNNKRKEFMKLEDQIAKLEVKKKEITDKMYSPDLSPDQLQKLAEELKETSGNLDKKSMAWLEIAEIMEGE